MKNYQNGIVLGIIAILFPLMFVGIPVSNGVLGIINMVAFVLGLLTILYFACVKKNDRATSWCAIAYFITLFVLSAIIDTIVVDGDVVAVGFVPGLIIGVVGLVITRRNKEKYKTKASLILNIIGLVLSIINFVLIIPNGGFIIYG